MGSARAQHLLWLLARVDCAVLVPLVEPAVSPLSTRQGLTRSVPVVVIVVLEYSRLEFVVGQPDRLETGGLPVATRVACCEIPVRQPPDRLAAAELVVVVDHDEIVAAAAQLVDRCRREAVFKTHLHAVQPTEPRSVARRLRVLAIVGDPHHQLQMPLRLHGAAHHAEAHHRCAVLW